MTVKLADLPASKAVAAPLAASSDPAVDDSADALQPEDPAVDEAGDASVDDPVLEAPTVNPVTDGDKPLFERNPSGVIRLTEVGANYPIRTVDTPILAFFNDEVFLFLPAGYTLMVHPEGAASCTVEGKAYETNGDGPVLVPDALVGALNSHGFQVFES